MTTGLYSRRIAGGSNIFCIVVMSALTAAQTMGGQDTHALLACLPAASKVRLRNLFLDLTIPSEKLDKLVSRNADYRTVYTHCMFLNIKRTISKYF